jgi:hypothetical protein
MEGPSDPSMEESPDIEEERLGGIGTGVPNFFYIQRLQQRVMDIDKDIQDLKTRKKPVPPTLIERKDDAVLDLYAALQAVTDAYKPEAVLARAKKRANFLHKYPVILKDYINNIPAPDNVKELYATREEATEELKRIGTSIKASIREALRKRKPATPFNFDRAIDRNIWYAHTRSDVSELQYANKLGLIEPTLERIKETYNYTLKVSNPRGETVVLRDYTFYGGIFRQTGSFVGDFIVHVTQSMFGKRVRKQYKLAFGFTMSDEEYFKFMGFYVRDVLYTVFSFTDTSSTKRGQAIAKDLLFEYSPPSDPEWNTPVSVRRGDRSGDTFIYYSFDDLIVLCGALIAFVSGRLIAMFSDKENIDPLLPLKDVIPKNEMPLARRFIIHEYAHFVWDIVDAVTSFIQYGIDRGYGWSVLPHAYIINKDRLGPLVRSASGIKGGVDKMHNENKPRLRRQRRIGSAIGDELEDCEESLLVQLLNHPSDARETKVDIGNSEMNRDKEEREEDEETMEYEEEEDEAWVF